MAKRPIFIPAPDEAEFVKAITFNFAWNSGFSAVQKKKNIKALHKAAAAAGYSPLLEISTKSDENMGRSLRRFSPENR